MAAKLEYSILQLVRALGDERHGGLAAQALVHTTSTLITALTQELQSPTSEARGQAAFVLGRIGGKIHDIIEGLIQGLADVDEAVCQYTATALSQIGKPAVPALIKALQDEEPEVKFFAVTALADFAEPPVEAVEALIDSLGSDYCGVRWVAVEVLQSIGTPEALRAIETYKNHESERYQPSHLYNEEA